MGTASSRTKWFRDAGWGVFLHYLADAASHIGAIDLAPDRWNRRVDAFDVDGLAAQLASVGAPYCFITVGQNSGHWLAPNETYDQIVGIRPSKCSERDLVGDLSDALASRGIRLMVYVPATAPSNDAVAVEKLQWRWGFKKPWPAFGGEKTGQRLAEFQKQWEAIIRDWSERWGAKVHGWWVDGAYFADEMYRHDEPPNFESFASALRAGNPDSIVAFNPGAFVPVAVQSEHEDYTAGEIDIALPVSQWEDGARVTINGRVEHAQFHVLTYLGQWWGQGEPRLPDDLVAAYARFVVAKCGVISLDVPPAENGLIGDAHLRQLAAVGQGVAALA